MIIIGITHHNITLCISFYFRTKQGSSNQAESAFISGLEDSVTLEFEKCDAARKLRLVLSELFFVKSKVC